MQVFYTVKSGDNISRIAKRWRIPLNSLIIANNLVSPYNIYPGQQLSMPPGVNTYVVKPGDSLFTISQMYGLPVKILIDANGIDYPYTIESGQVLFIPSGVPYYTVRTGDSLYKIALKYNVTVNGLPRPDLIINANEGLTQNLNPGMTIAIPFPPPGGPGSLAILFNDSIRNYLGIYQFANGRLNTILIDEADVISNIFYSPDRRSIALVNNIGVVSIIDLNTGRISRIDQIEPYSMVSWSPDSKKIVYSNGVIIRIYDITNNTYQTINKQNVLYPQWFPNGQELLYEGKNVSGISQLYRINTDGSNERQITKNSGSNYNNVRLSPNGKYVLYTTPGASISEIYTIDLATGILYKIPGGPEAKNYYPTWSPDSSKIAYSSTQFINGKYYSLIRISGLKGDNDITIAISSCYSTPITWSPDSRKIIYLSGCRDENIPVEVWSIDIQKPAPINILSGFYFYNLA